MGKLEGKVAVITGGATGIGRAAAKRFIEEGALVFIFGRRQEALDAAVADLGPNARAVKGSVSDLADLDRLYAAVKAERGTLDIVFANAGAGSQLALESYATTLPGLYLYFPSRANLSPPLRAFVDLAREMTKPRKKRP